MLQVFDVYIWAWVIFCILFMAVIFACFSSCYRWASIMHMML